MTPVPNFTNMSNIAEKKQSFFSYMNQQLSPVNNHILAERQKLLQLQSTQLVRYADKIFLRQMAQKYRLLVTEKMTVEQQITTLLNKVDRIPPALILAQAANESAWGTSRFARQANNYFGIWCFSKGCGLIPKARGVTERHEVRRFNSAKESIAYYVNLLNSHKTYQALRSIRANLTINQKPVTANALTVGLQYYSERGDAYIQDLQQLIRFNNLDELYPLVEKE